MVPLVGEPLALDLVNTRGGSGGDEFDLLADADGARRWLALQIDRLPVTGDVEPAALRALREYGQQGARATR